MCTYCLNARSKAYVRFPLFLYWTIKSMGWIVTSMRRGAQRCDGPPKMVKYVKIFRVLNRTRCNVIGRRHSSQYIHRSPCVGLLFRLPYVVSVCFAFSFARLVSLISRHFDAGYVFVLKTKSHSSKYTYVNIVSRDMCWYRVYELLLPEHANVDGRRWDLGLAPGRIVTIFSDRKPYFHQE